jgi:hypothetical protein
MSLNFEDQSLELLFDLGTTSEPEQPVFCPRCCVGFVVPGHSLCVSCNTEEHQTSKIELTDKRLSNLEDRSNVILDAVIANSTQIKDMTNLTAGFAINNGVYEKRFNDIYSKLQEATMGCTNNSYNLKLSRTYLEGEDDNIRKSVVFVSKEQKKDRDETGARFNALYTRFGTLHYSYLDEQAKVHLLSQQNTQLTNTVTKQQVTLEQVIDQNKYLTEAVAKLNSRVTIHDQVVRSLVASEQKRAKRRRDTVAADDRNVAARPNPPPTAAVDSSETPS